MRSHERPKEYLRLVGAGGSHIQFICLRVYVFACVCVCISLILARRLFCCSVVRDAKLSGARRISHRSPQRNPLWFTVHGSSFNIRGSFEKDTVYACIVSCTTCSIIERRNMDSILRMRGICSTTFLHRSHPLKYEMYKLPELQEEENNVSLR